MQIDQGTRRGDAIGPWIRVALLVVGLGLAGCSTPRLEGGIVTDVPPGFGFDANATGGRNAFPERDLLYERTWARISMDDTYSGITVKAYAGPLTADEAEATHRWQGERWGYADYSAIEPLTIDGRPAWGWLETQAKPGGPVLALTYRAMVGYDDETFLISYHSNQHEYLQEAHLRDVVTSFEIARAKPMWGLIIVVGAVALVAGFVVLRGRRSYEELKRRDAERNAA